MSKDKNWNLSSRMKDYEFSETEYYFDNNLPLICRIDGRNFSKFTKQFEKPYDENLSNMMKNLAKFIMDETNAKIAYQQSDEISLYFPSVSENSQRIFNGKKTKMISIISGLASAYFAKEYFLNFDFNNQIPHFDCRLYSLPDEVEVGNYFVWRQQDAKRNSVSMLAQSIFNHKTLQNKTRENMLEMISETNKDYFSMPFNFKYGSFFVKEQKRYFNNICGEYFRTVIVEKDIETFTYNMIGEI